MRFTNKQNREHIILDGWFSKMLFKIISFFSKKKIIWESRSVAVVGVIFCWLKNEKYPHILVSKRGKEATDCIGKMNLIAGYIDWDENGTEAVFRETWEEVGLDLNKVIEMSKGDAIIHLNQPWRVKTDPNTPKQNISLTYGLCFEPIGDIFPKLTTKYNEVIGETESPMWIPFKEIDNYEWAFNHDITIKNYFALLKSMANGK